MKRPRKPLPPREPCAYCNGDRTPATLARHNIACAQYGERSYGPFVSTALAAVLLLVACGRPFTGPVRCAPGEVRDTLYVDSLTSVFQCRGRS